MKRAAEERKKTKVIDLTEEEDNQTDQGRGHQQGQDDARRGEEEGEGEGTPTQARWTSPQLTFHLNHLKGYSPPENASTIKLTDIATEHCRSAILTTYQVDLEWLLKECPVFATIPTMIVHSDGRLGKQNLKVGNVHLKQPPLPLPYGTCHGKMLLLKYDSFLRVAITTANLLFCDYDLKTQAIWVQDFPKKGEEKGTKKVGPLAADFKNTLEDYIKKLELNSSFLENYDYENAKVVLISSVPGYHTKESFHKYGHIKIRKFFNDHKVAPQFNTAPLVAQFSSVGKLTPPWLNNEWMVSFCGKPTKLLSKPLESHFVWPTLQFVKDSNGGYESGGSLCYPKKNHTSIPHNKYYQYTPSFSRKRVPPHIKCYTRADESSNLSWVLMTSANMSAAAWGALQKNETQFMIRNYEIGVLFYSPYFGENVTLRAGLPEVTYHKETEEVESVSYPLPYTLPLVPYSKEDQPWLWDVPHSEPDIFGKTWKV